jgi:hypothetical protein
MSLWGKSKRPAKMASLTGTPSGETIGPDGLPLVHGAAMPFWLAFRLVPTCRFCVFCANTARAASPNRDTCTPTCTYLQPISINDVWLQYIAIYNERDNLRSDAAWTNGFKVTHFDQRAGGQACDVPHDTEKCQIINIPFTHTPSATG